MDENTPFLPKPRTDWIEPGRPSVTAPSDHVKDDRYTIHRMAASPRRDGPLYADIWRIRDAERDVLLPTRYISEPHAQRAIWCLRYGHEWQPVAAFPIGVRPEQALATRQVMRAVAVELGWYCPACKQSSKPITVLATRLTVRG